MKKIPPPQLHEQFLHTCSTIGPDFVDKPTCEEVEARAMAYTTSFEVDVSKISQPPKDVSTLGLYYLLSDNMSSVNMQRDILHDPEKCIEILRIMEQNKNS